MRSKKGTPRPIYFFATLITSLELAVTKCSFAAEPSMIKACSLARRLLLTFPLTSSFLASKPRSIRLARLTSSSLVSSGTLLTSLRYSPMLSNESIFSRSSASCSSSSSSYSVSINSCSGAFGKLSSSSASGMPAVIIADITSPSRSKSSSASGKYFRISSKDRSVCFLPSAISLDIIAEFKLSSLIKWGLIFFICLSYTPF